MWIVNRTSHSGLCRLGWSEQYALEELIDWNLLVLDDWIHLGILNDRGISPAKPFHLIGCNKQHMHAELLGLCNPGDW